jgi:hypothetical protein
VWGVRAWVCVHTHDVHDGVCKIDLEALSISMQSDIRMIIHACYNVSLALLTLIHTEMLCISFKTPCIVCVYSCVCIYICVFVLHTFNYHACNVYKYKYFHSTNAWIVFVFHKVTHDCIGCTWDSLHTHMNIHIHTYIYMCKQRENNLYYTS